MSIFTRIFGDPFERRLGSMLIEYFRKDEFPPEILQDPDICYMYFLAQYHYAIETKNLNDEQFIDCWKALLAECRRRGCVFPTDRD